MKKILSILLATLSFSAMASDVIPIRNYIGKKTEFSTDRTAIFYVDGSDLEKAKIYDVQIKKWNQNALVDTNDIQAFPPIVRVEPRTNAPVKLLLKVSRKEVQQTYRVIFTPRHTQEDEKFGIDFAYNIPIFVEPTVPKNVKLDFKEDKGFTIVKNIGNTTLELKQFIKSDKSKISPIYLLPDSEIKIPSVDKEYIEYIKQSQSNENNIP